MLFSYFEIDIYKRGVLRLRIWRINLRSPKAQIIPNITQNIPPTIGSGIMMNTAPNLLITPCRIIRKQAHCMTLRLPTLVIPKYFRYVLLNNIIKLAIKVYIIAYYLSCRRSHQMYLYHCHYPKVQPIWYPNLLYRYHGWSRELVVVVLLEVFQSITSYVIVNKNFITQ